MKNRRVIGSVLLSIIMAFLLFVSPVLASEGDFPISGGIGADFLNEDSEFRISIQSLDSLLKEAGQTWREWDAHVSESRKETAAVPLTIKELQDAYPDVQILRADQYVYMITGENLPFHVSGIEDAADLAYWMLPLLGRDTDTDLMLISRIIAGGKQKERIYVFQEIQDGIAVMGNTLRLVTDDSDHVIAVFSSLSEENPEDPAAEDTAEKAQFAMADADTAEHSVEDYLQETGISGTILSAYTSPKLFLQETDEEGINAMMSDEVLPDLLRWVVYSESADGSCLAHYVAADGTYIYHQKVRTPGDEAGQSGYDAAYFFDGMEAAEWSGEVPWSDGSTRSVTVPVMKDPKTGRYYLGDVKRRILVGEFSDYVYQEETLTPVSSADNMDWETDDLITLHTFIQIWDYYKDLGWKGPDGQGSPSLLLRRMQTENEVLLDNAAYGARFKGWSIFAYDNSLTHYEYGLDVWAHEYTHSVTTTLQVSNLYQNDQGAINESLSDILGNLGEILMADPDDHSWKMGEDTAYTVRGMLDPHAFDQPEYVWDIFYGSSTSKPNDCNDRGGVHSKSAILNLLAAKLCESEAMPLTTARDFWLRLCCMLTPENDLPQIADILEWAVSAPETMQWTGAVARLIKEGQFRRTSAPENLGAGKKMVELTLPDTPDMQDENWILAAYQVDEEGLLNIIGRVMEAALSGADMNSEEDAGLMDTVINEMLSGDAHLIYQYTSWTDGDSQTIYMPILDKPTVYVMMNMDTDLAKLLSLSVLMGDYWFDLSEALSIGDLVSTGDPSAVSEELLEQAMEEILKLGGGFLSSLFGPGNEEQTTKDNGVIILPSDGLEDIRLPESEEQARAE